MSRFNEKVSTRGRQVTENLAGGKAYELNKQEEFLLLLFTSMLDQKFYRSDNQTCLRMIELISQLDPMFVAKAAVYTRETIYLRTVSHVAAGEVVGLMRWQGQEWVKLFIERVVQRVDDMSEITSYFLNKFGKPLPNALKKGLRLAFNKFDSYQLAKYRGENKSLKLIDLVNLIHPKPTDRNNEGLKKLVEGTLVSTDTWESQLSEAGKADNVDEAKSKVWETLLTSKRLGYMALLKNLSNILVQAPHMIDETCAQITNKESISRSKQLPFRFFSAYEQLLTQPGSQKLVSAVSFALNFSVKNMPKLSGKTLIVLDVSGSMIGKPITIGSIFAISLLKKNFGNADFMVFSNDATYDNSYPQNIDVITGVDLIKRKAALGGTDFHSIFKTANVKYDRVFILSDMQGWANDNRVWGYSGQRVQETFLEYKNKFNVNPYIYSFDLNGYGSIQYKGDKVYVIGGWSEKIFDVVDKLETDKNILLKTINDIKF